VRLHGPGGGDLSSRSWANPTWSWAPLPRPDRLWSTQLEDAMTDLLVPQKNKWWWATTPHDFADPPAQVSATIAAMSRRSAAKRREWMLQRSCLLPWEAWRAEPALLSRQPATLQLVSATAAHR